MENTSIEQLLTALESKPDLPLRFYLGDTSINQGYHVTEVKYAQIKSMDCGKHTDSWDEIFIQLLDGNEKSSQGYMSTSKFIGIVGAALKALPDQTAPYLFFEFSPNNAALPKLSIQEIACDNNEVSVHLAYETAGCKPFQKWGAAGDMLEYMYTGAVKTDCCSGDTKRCC